MALQMSDLLLRLRAMPSSPNDALRTMDEAAYHIDALERGLRKLQARIEALEAALREMADLVDVEGRRTIDHCYSIARAELDKDDGK